MINKINTSVLIGTNRNACLLTTEKPLIQSINIFFSSDKMAPKIVTTFIANSLLRTSSCRHQNIYPKSIGRKCLLPTTSSCLDDFKTFSSRCFRDSLPHQWKIVTNSNYNTGNCEEFVSCRRKSSTLTSKNPNASVEGQFKYNQQLWLPEHQLLKSISTATNPRRTKHESSSAKVTTSEEDKSNITKTIEQKHENVLTVPNLLCVSRIVAAPYLAHVIINNADFSWALVIFMYAGLTDAVSYTLTV